LSGVIHKLMLMDYSTIAHLIESDRAGPGDGREIPKNPFYFWLRLNS